MKVIQRSSATGATADSENAAWPASNVLTDAVKKCWRAASSSVASATVTVGSSGLQDSVAVFGIVGDRITVTVSDPNATEWEASTEWEAGTEWATITPTAVQSLLASDLTDSGSAAIGGQKGVAWFEFDEFVSEVNIALTVENLTGRPMELSIGTVVVGKRTEFPNPKLGFDVSIIDYSIERELANGAVYYKKRDLVREFTGEYRLSEPEMEVLFQLVRRYGRTNMAWILIDGGGATWLTYGRIAPLIGRYESLYNRSMRITVREAV